MACRRQAYDRPLAVLSDSATLSNSGRAPGRNPCLRLRPKGQALIRDLRKDVSLEEIQSYIRQSGRSWFDARPTKMAFPHALIKGAYTIDDFERMASPKQIPNL